ncbi:hypothetical protein JCM11251_002166 [Rhodosporidiobolus azoricus]
MARPSPSPVASTSRIPYTAPSSPFSTSALRAFSSSAPSHAGRRSRGGAHAHLINPLLRQRLTNLTFLLAGALSIATVSLTMSGSLNEAGLPAPGCPARSTAGVVAQEERKRRLGEEQRQREVERGWWSKGRFLEDPPAPVMSGLGAPPTATAPARQEKTVRPAVEKRAREGEDERIAGPRETKVPPAEWGWRTDERVV